MHASMHACMHACAARSVVENINLPKNLMTRFDFIWLMIDKRSHTQSLYRADPSKYTQIVNTNHPLAAGDPKH